MPVFAVLALLYFASVLTTTARDMGYSWINTILIGLALSAALATANTFAPDQPVEGVQTSWIQHFTTTSAVGLASVALRWRFEKR